jgi:hypothetical protein
MSWCSWISVIIRSFEPIFHVPELAYCFCAVMADCRITWSFKHAHLWVELGDRGMRRRDKKSLKIVGVLEIVSNSCELIIRLQMVSTISIYIYYILGDLSHKLIMSLTKTRALVRANWASMLFRTTCIGRERADGLSGVYHADLEAWGYIW